MQTFLTFAQQHWMLSVALVALIIAVLIYESLFGQNAAGNVVSPHEAVQLINRQDAIVLDVRRRDAFVRGHIINAVHIPMADLEKDIKKLNQHKKKPLIVVCAQGLESAKAIKFLNTDSFPEVKILKGGLAAWRDDKLPLEKA